MEKTIEIQLQEHGERIATAIVRELVSLPKTCNQMKAIEILWDFRRKCMDLARSTK